MRYLTPLGYRWSDEGILPLPPNGVGDVSDLSLARYIARAEAAIDAYVEMPLFAPNGFAPGIVGMVQQGFDMANDAAGGFGMRKLRIPLPLVPVRNIQRIQIHISNASPSGQPLVAILQPGEVVINNWDNYCECIALTLTYSLSAVVWELGTNPPIAEWDLETGYYLPYLGDLLWDQGDATTYRAVRGWWAIAYDQASSNQPAKLPPIPPVVYVNRVPAAQAVLSQALVAGQAYTSLAVNALAQTFSNGAVLVVNDGSGSVATVVTLSAQANAGATTLSIASFTPSVAYAAGTVLGLGFAVNYNEGAVTFSTKQTGNPTVTADYTAQIPDLVQEACIAQVTWYLQQRALNIKGAGGLELVHSGATEIRRARTDDTEEDQLCARARMKLARYVPVGIA